MTIPAKTAAGMGALGTAAGGGVLLSKSPLFSKQTPTLRKEVEDDGWVLLTSSNTTEIQSILGAYKKDNPKATLLLDGLTGGESDASEKLLQICKGLQEKPTDAPSKEDLLAKLKKWCVVPKTTKQRLTELGYSPLSTDNPSNGTESQEWKAKGTNHHGSQQGKFAGVETNGDENERAKKLREHCKTKLEVKSFEEEFNDTFSKVKNWCTN
ncbi:hypothetical protein MHF_1352 [Mycoplasma haemofelis Ohio2]|uniref:Uncharacterized protein n=1 Tax=Mycoplasma haemofelis (strain Ohio2) TaxID=859194 RepID=F6FG90_MYCHI|nr:hypothetical protein MHF_1352 [Mycoplasma haemofelis Ohio2]